MMLLFMVLLRMFRSFLLNVMAACPVNARGGCGAHMFRIHGHVHPVRRLFDTTQCGCCLREFHSFGRLKAHLIRAEGILSLRLLALALQPTQSLRMFSMDFYLLFKVKALDFLKALGLACRRLTMTLRSSRRSTSSFWMRPMPGLVRTSSGRCS